MIFSVVVCAVACLGLIISVLLKPSIIIKGHSFPIYFLPALVGSILLLSFNVLPIKEAWSGLTASGTMNPLKILTLFLSLTFLSIFLDELGFFKKLATLLIGRSGGNQKKLFLEFYVLVSLLTMFTSNDVVILTFTPFICCFCKNEKISPIPYLIAEFVAANTWSMALIIGNPTNIYLAGTCEIGFFEYLSVMWLPTLFAGISAFCVLWLLFRKSLSRPCEPTKEEVKIEDKGMLIIAIVHLCGCIIALSIFSFIDISMWLVAVGFALSLILTSSLYALIRKRKKYGRLLKTSLMRAPWELVPFVLSMFIIVLSLERYEITDKITAVLSGKCEFIKYGVASFLFSNLINNIPMSVLFGGVLKSSAPIKNVLATIIGSNIGAYLTPVGALAGIMWTGLLKKYYVDFSFRKFLLYGSILSITSLFFALLGLSIML